MNVGILAAGAGSRLRAGGLHLPKPLLPVAGVPLIGRLLRALQPLTPEAIVCIINSQGSSIADYVRQHYPALPIEFVQQDTASSYESFTVLCAHLHGSPCLVTTVDSVFPPDFLPQFVAGVMDDIIESFRIHLINETPDAIVFSYHARTASGESRGDPRVH